MPAPSPGVITGEASPYYLFHPHTARRAHQWNPQIKLIVLLRNPVERAYSHYRHEVRLGMEDLSFEAALAAEVERLAGEEERMRDDESYHSLAHQHYSYLARGIYVSQLEAWSLFPREQMLILQSEALFQSPQLSLRRIHEFLGLTTAPVISFPKVNDGSYPPMRPETRTWLAEYFRPHNRRLAAYLGWRPSWDL